MIQVRLVFKLFLLMGAGAFLRHRNVVTEEGKLLLTDLILKVVLPCSILTSFLKAEAPAFTGAPLQMLLLSVGIQAASFALSFVLYRFCKEEHRTVLKYATICSNSGILGTPVTTELYGEAAGLYAALYLLPLRIAMWTLGLFLFTGKRENGSLLKMLLHPCVVATLLGTLLLFLRIPVPALLADTVATVGACNTFLSLMLVGCTLAEMNPRLLISGEAVYYVFIRLFALPLFVYAACLLLRTDVFVRSVAVSLTAMPAGATTAILAVKYNKSPDFAATISALSTLFSLVAIPLWYLFL